MFQHFGFFVHLAPDRQHTIGPLSDWRWCSSRQSWSEGHYPGALDVEFLYGPERL